MIDVLRVVLGVELILAVIAFLAGGPFGTEDVVKVFVASNVIAGMIALAIFLIASGVR